MRPSISVEQLTDELRRRGLINADSPPEATAPRQRPWFISIVLGFSGWLAGAFVLAFVFILFKPSTAASYALPGVILLAAAFGLYAADRDNAFFDQLALALSIAGQFALAFAAGQATHSAAATAGLVAVMQIVLLLVMPNELAKGLAAFFACCAWALAIRFAWWGEWRWETTRDQVALGPALLGWLVVWVPIVAIAHVLVMTERAWIAQGLARIARPALTGLLLSLCVAMWVSEPLASLEFWESGVQAQTNWRVIWPLLGIIGSLIAVLYAFLLGSRAIIGVAIAGALLHVVQFYYLLGTTLLIKSCIMIAVGVVALLAAVGLRGQSEEGAS